MMECNKDEAIRVRDIAELKFAKKDLVGAKKFILKALELYPKLDGAIQLSTILDVHIAAQVKVGIRDPELDHYRILQVNPRSDESAIQQQYRNLAILVHPDKNKKSMEKEATVAFQLIGEAFRTLSDEKTRFQHDSKRGEKSMAKEPPKPTYSTNQPQHNATAQPPPATGAQASQAPYTFLTACPFCQMQYQCMSTFLNYQIVCQKCHSYFPATDISVYTSNRASTFVSPPGLRENNNPFPTRTSWPNGERNKNHQIPSYGASTNGTYQNNHLPTRVFSGANSNRGYGSSPSMQRNKTYQAPPYGAATIWHNIPRRSSSYR